MTSWNDELVDRIYEAAFTPEIWDGVLDELARGAGARGGVFFAADRRVLNWTASDNLRETFGSYVGDGWLQRCTRRARWLTETRPSFLVEHDLWTDEELDQNPIYRDFLRPLGLGWSAGMALPLPTGDRIVFSFEREYASGPMTGDAIQRLNQMRPHLARSALVAARLRLERWSSAAEALGAIGVPALALTREGKAVAVNALMDQVGDCVRLQPGDRLAFLDGSADRLLSDALSALGTAGAASTRSFPVRNSPGPPLVAHLVPIRGSARDVFANGVALLVLTPVTMPKAPPVDLVRSLFDLTPAEARVACSLAAVDQRGRHRRFRRRVRQHRPHAVALGACQDGLLAAGGDRRVVVRAVDAVRGRLTRTAMDPHR